MAFLPIEPITACALILACLAYPAQPAETSLDLATTDSGGQVSTASLTCEPPGGSHRNRDAACAAIDQANGNFGRLPKRRQLCTLEYAPIYATAKGTWRGKPVEFGDTYPNPCVAGADSGGVFEF